MCVVFILIPCICPRCVCVEQHRKRSTLFYVYTQLERHIDKQRTCLCCYTIVDSLFLSFFSHLVATREHVVVNERESQFFAHSEILSLALIARKSFRQSTCDFSRSHVCVRSNIEYVGITKREQRERRNFRRWKTYC